MQQPGRRVTIYDVAERAGVSISTVSLAINSPHRVSEATRQRILTAAGTLGYRTGPSPAQNRGGIRIAVAAPFTTYPSYLRRLTGVLDRARSTAIDIVTYDLPSAAWATAPLLDALPARRGLDGVIVMGVPLSGAALRASRESRLPVVLVDTRPPRHGEERPSAVLIDDLAGGRAIGRHLRGQGHRHVIFLHEPQMSGEYVSAGMVRVSGLAEFVEVADAACPATADPGVVARAALVRHPSATAVVAHHDGLAAQIWRRFRHDGTGREDVVALVGYDDGPIAETIDLTTVRQPFEESGAKAFDLLVDEMTSNTVAPRVVMLEPQLLVRGTA